MIRLDLVNVGVLPESGNVVLVLRATDLSKLLIMDIGPFEGRAIAMGAAGTASPRPMTHDLLVETLAALGGKIQHVFIREFRDQTFFATLAVNTGTTGLLEIDSRPSDAVACAVRTGAPIFVDEAVLEATGIREDEIETAVDGPGELGEMTDDSETSTIH